jgi:hypothetical protein
MVFLLIVEDQANTDPELPHDDTRDRKHLLSRQVR